jgi:hypothetical protein
MASAARVGTPMDAAKCAARMSDASAAKEA